MARRRGQPVETGKRRDFAPNFAALQYKLCGASMRARFPEKPLKKRRNRIDQAIAQD
jgi:hypothetical protein